MRRIVASLVGLVTVAAVALGTAPSAFAMKLLPVPEGTATPIVVASPHSSGPAIWPFFLVGIIALVVVVAICAGVVWSSRRVGLRTAGG